ncbi:hypothetical protein QEH44_gp34 [Arthrobacter phage Shambre1]|uniref:Uncharacterized protein n=1 Tax=Arthrobacter phage Shambre1 TaxID=2927284 RepID=A0A977KNK9_9CAUD|nr:hypothetical protein QEH44_gp34 [Arthrobacter phage Shambre1]UXE04770.1 hypothetical protein SEA_SHAMBRE1_34 [Arthrobacter phage Shambre1]
MATTAAAASRKADALHNRLVKALRDHDFGFVIMTWVEGEDIVLRVKADNAPALDVREWLNAGLRGHDLYRIADSVIGKAIAAELARRQRDADWLAACAAMKH